MRIITFSDLHLEFSSPLVVPMSDADVLVLAGDILPLKKNYLPLEKFLGEWKKPVIYIPGNHEYYTKKPMRMGINYLNKWLALHPNIHFLDNASVTIDGVHFFGGTMWTNFRESNPLEMLKANNSMNDFVNIYRDGPDCFRARLRPEDTVSLHNIYKELLIEWLKETKGKRVVVSHHCPGVQRQLLYKDHDLQAAYTSYDMLDVIINYEPDLWIFGHTHQCEDSYIGKTRIISNQSGYPKGKNFECKEFDPMGKMVEI